MNDTPPERTIFQNIERLCFLLGILFFFSFFLISILNGFIFYTNHNDIRPLLTSTIGKVIAPDYVLYLSLTTLRDPNLTKETADGIKFQWAITFFLFIALHILLAMLVFRIDIAIKYRILLFLGIWLLYFVACDILYVFLLSKHLYIPYTGFVKSFLPDSLALFFSQAGSSSIEATFLTETNVTLII